MPRDSENIAMRHLTPEQTATSQLTIQAISSTFEHGN